jgi:hypothetical protein
MLAIPIGMVSDEVTYGAVLLSSFKLRVIKNGDQKL